MRINLSVIKRTLLLVAPVLLISCANVVSPTGGPVDRDPPVVLRSDPPNFSTQYRGQDIRIFFNEFVDLRNLRQNLLVSPPLANDPEIRVRGRSIIISISDTLLPNTTYNFFLGESVVDITEGNAIPNFQFVVSTGAFVDSLSVEGRLLNAFTLLPEEGVFVMMYDNIYDSVPLMERPVYITKTDKEGNYRINNIREGEFLLFALRDMNSNYIYDNPNEKIAFLDSLITPVFLGKPIEENDLDSLRNELDPLSAPEWSEEEQSVLPADESGPEAQVVDSLIPPTTIIRQDLSADTLPIQFPADSLLIFNDTILKDSLNLGISQVQSVQPPFYTLFLFQEADTVQRVTSAQLMRRGHVRITFRIPTDSIQIREYTDEPEENWYIPELSINRDTLHLWIPSLDRDTIRLEMSDRNLILDSLTISLVERQPRGRVPTTRTQPEEEFLQVEVSSTGGRSGHPYFRPFELVSATPVRSFRQELFQLVLKDTIEIEKQPDFAFINEVQRVMRMQTLPEQGKNYELFIHPGAIVDIFGNRNDTLLLNFRVNKEEDYGTIILHIDTLPDIPDRQYILQLTDDKLERVIQEKIINGGGEYRFEHLIAAKFRARIVFDDNKNGKWDTGNYLRRRQPERVLVFREEIQSRINWEVESIWNISDN